LVVNRAYVVGVDGGATKTVALIGTTAGILARGESGSSNYHNIGTVAAGKAIRTAVLNAKKQAGLQGTRVGTAVVALAGIDSTRGVEIARRFVRHANVALKTFVIHDSVAAVYAATQGEPGITVNSGTGCFAAGINGAGEYVRVGGWGRIIDDKGSAFDIGMKAITDAFRMVDGRTPHTQLTTLLKRRFHVRRFDGILDSIYSNQMGVEEIAQLAPFVSKAASHDRVCRQILREAAMSLAELACTAARRLKMTDSSFPLVMVGGGFRSGRYLVDPFKSRVRDECPRARFVKPKDEPVRGAYLIATRLALHGLRTLPRNDRWLRKVVN
jgi:N-acetylglucosamine kinase-like BadF-type ATPase